MLRRVLNSILATTFFLLLFTPITHAANGADWAAGNIISDGVFANANAMSVADIQAFLNTKVGTGGSAYATPGFCDTQGTRTSEFGGGTRAQYATSTGRSTPFTCLKDYYEVPKVDPAPGIPANNYGGTPIPAGAISAAEMVWNAGQRYSVNPRVLLVMIQKESAGPLITDDWPFLSQYTYAMGAHCPDSGPGGAANCDPNYAGFSMQIQESARLLRYYITNMDQPWWTYKKLGANDILYQNSRPSCGSSTVNIVTRATAALYTYTPYQPNQAALNNLYGLGDECSAYGNRNFWRMFIDWFGSTQLSVPYGWTYVNQEAFVDANHTQKFTSVPTVAPGGKIYVRVQARNIGFQTWANTNFRIGSSHPYDRDSIFADTSWISTRRAANLVESSVSPGQVGTFDFVLKAPSSLGTYNEYFNLLVEGREWLNDPGLFFTINVNNPGSASILARPALTQNQSLRFNEYLLSSDAQSVITIQRDGSLAAIANFKTAWSSGSVGGNSSNRLIMQSDGNLVLYSAANVPLWNTETQGNPGAYLYIQTDGNLVLYSAANVPLWATYTIHVPDHLSYINTILNTGLLYPGQQINTADRKYKLILQPDGNLVLYSPTRALWATGTDGKPTAFLAMQPDGNLVLYDKDLRPLWNSRTGGIGTLRLIMQPDGNLVLYDRSNRPVWNTATQGL
jgi:hypothetical protein